MDPKTYLVLKKELFEHPYGADGEYTVSRLFKIYTTYEFNKMSDIHKDHKSFMYFVYNNIDCFDLTRDKDGNISPEEKKSVTSMARYLSLHLESLYNKHYHDQRREQEKFVEMVEKIVGNNKINILEVGSGSVPYSSILLANDLDGISSMDEFLVSDESLKSFNINPLNRYFTEKDSVSDYDLIIGQKPCSAIAEIVKKCGKENKPYFLQLCQCNSPTNDLTGWKDYLTALDHKIRFSIRCNYAYNLDSPMIME